MMFGDNASVVQSSLLPKSCLHKRHVMLSFHRVQEANAAGIVNLIFIVGNINHANVMSKHWGYQSVRTYLQALLTWEGDTIDIGTE